MAETATLVATALLTLALATLFVHLASKLLVRKATLVRSFLAVLVGTVLASLVHLGGTGAGWRPPVIMVLVLAAFALGLAVVYRESWLKGAVLGFVAWLAWAFVSALWRAVLS